MQGPRSCQFQGGPRSRSRWQPPADDGAAPLPHAARAPRAAAGRTDWLPLRLAGALHAATLQRGQLGADLPMQLPARSVARERVERGAHPRPRLLQVAAAPCEQRRIVRRLERMRRRGARGAQVDARLQHQVGGSEGWGGGRPARSRCPCCHQAAAAPRRAPARRCPAACPAPPGCSRPQRAPAPATPRLGSTAAPSSCRRCRPQSARWHPACMCGRSERLGDRARAGICGAYANAGTHVCASNACIAPGPHALSGQPTWPRLYQMSGATSSPAHASARSTHGSTMSYCPA